MGDEVGAVKGSWGKGEAGFPFLDEIFTENGVVTVHAHFCEFCFEIMRIHNFSGILIFMRIYFFLYFDLLNKQILPNFK